jgi:hypothetical protein
MRPFRLLLSWCLLLSGLWAQNLTQAPQTFLQERALHRDSAQSLPTTPVQLLDRAPDGSLLAFANGAWLRRVNHAWTAVPELQSSAPTSFTLVGPDGLPTTLPQPPAQVLQILRSGPTLIVVTSSDLFEWKQGKFASLGWDTRSPLRQAALSPAGRLWVASAGGLFERQPSAWTPLPALDSFGRNWAAAEVLGVAFDAQGLPWIATRAGVGCQTSKGWRFWEGRDGLPWNDFTGVTAGLAGEVWFATHLGVIRWDGSDFHYRQGLRWLPSDDVRQILVDADGSAWLATALGLGAIVRQPMTLQAKAERYEAELDQYIRRTPFGFTAEAPLRRPADLSSAAPDDSDNDGLWTAMYGAGECFAYAATKNPASLARAKKAFEALRFLQVVTQGGDHAPPKGFVARTIRSTADPDPNVGRLAGDLEEQKHDALWKAYEPRWPKSADGKWYWKSDTSSDELDGHYFLYALYYDFCAETETEKARVREVVRDLTDHLLTHDFNLVDHDGKATRWGVYGPGEINRNPLWWAERGLNSLSLISYLTVAGHVTGDPKYDQAIQRLVAEHGYGQNLMFPKVQLGTGSGNHSDDEMAFMCYYNFLRLSKLEGLKSQVRYSFYQSWALEQPELNPFFHYAYAAINQGQSITNGWGVFPVSPWPGWQEDSLATLRGFPLDRLNWAHKNSHRLDLVPLERQRARDLYDEDRRGRGHRVNGKVLPVENRHFEHWNTDPWVLDYGGNGNVLGSGTVFLLPYYMGMYHGYIAKP